MRGLSRAADEKISDVVVSPKRWAASTSCSSSTMAAGLDRELVYVCYCASLQCNAAVKGALRLAERGFRAKVLSGGLATWTAAGYPVDGIVDSAACAC